MFMPGKPTVEGKEKRQRHRLRDTFLPNRGESVTYTTSKRHWLEGSINMTAIFASHAWKVWKQPDIHAYPRVR